MPRTNRNWTEYNRKLINRGRITVWIDPDLVKNPFDKQKGRGRPRFSDAYLIAALCIRHVYGLDLRALQGFLEDLVRILGLNTPVPSYSLFSKRMKNLKMPKLSSRRPTHLLVDSSGVKIAGEGEWKVKVHGVGKRRKWIKLHIGIDEKTQEVVALKATPNNVGDCTALGDLLERSPNTVKRLSADGAYDGYPTRKLLYDKGIEGVIPPPSNAAFRKEKEMEWRNQFLQVWKSLGGDSLAKKLSKKLCGYHRRSLVETAFSRLKRRFGDRFDSRTFANQAIEGYLKCWILNRMPV